MTVEQQLATAFLESHSSRAAMTMERMPAAQAAAVLRVVPGGAAAAVLRDMTPPSAAACLSHLPPEDAATIVAQMTADDAASVLRVVDPDVRERLFAAMTADAREPIARVLSYPEGTAGAVMDPSIFQLPDDTLVADARIRLRRAARDLLYYLYVVDREHRLVGVLDIRELMLARPRDRVSAAMHREVDRLSAWTPVRLVLDHPGWHRYHAMPVVDEHDRLLGAIRYQLLRRLERAAADRGPDSSLLTARALGELFQLGTTGLVAGVAATASAGRTLEENGETTARKAATHDAEVRDAE